MSLQLRLIVRVATVELDSVNLRVVREGGVTFRLKAADKRVAWRRNEMIKKCYFSPPLLTGTGDKTGPDIVRPPHGVRPSQQVGPVVTNETDTVGPGVILVRRKCNEGITRDPLLCNY